MSDRLLEDTYARAPHRVRHKKTGGIYRVLFGNATIEADMTVAVVYQSEIGGRVWVRPVAEFKDGRFERVCPD